LPRFRIHDRIAVPFALVALAATVVAALISLSLISRAVNARVDAQLERASAVVMRGDFALNPAILPLISDIAGSHIVTYSSDGTVLASTLDESQHGGLIAAIIAGGRAPAGDASSSRRRIEHDGVPYSVAYSGVTTRAGATVALARDTSLVEASVRAATRTVVGTAAITVLILMIASRVIARRISAPIEHLLEVTRDVGSGSTRRAISSGSDEIGRLGAAFNDMLDRVEQSQSALLRSEKLAVTGLLAARIAHDVRNPLSSIKMQTQLLRSRLRGQEDNQAVLISVLREVAQVETVINGLLELARPGELKRRTVALNEAIEDVLLHVMPQLTHNKIAIETAFATDLPPVSLDVERFRQAVMNVIVNAAEAMPGGGTLTVTTDADPANSTVVLDVCDDGAGLDPSIAGRAFDPFVSTKRDGVGLGLVNTKAVVESHGGRVELTPRAGRGTRARITIPAKAEP
jgi:signal transduction histidine kinase